jgi:AraC-like DNA-binding protein
MSGLRFCSAGHLKVDPSWSMRRHDHAVYEMMVMHGGRLAVEIGGEQLHAGPGDVLLYAPHIPHQERVEGGEDADFSFFGFWADAAPARPLAPDVDGRMRLLVSWLLQEESVPYRRTGLLDSILSLMLLEYERLCARRESTLAERVRAFLEKRLDGPVEIDDIARAARMSRAHFMRSYKRETGRTPMQELRALRLARARELILTTALPLRAVAERVGMADEQHLSHVFRRVLGVPPGYFRRGR